MAYEQPKPESHYVVSVQVHEVTPAHTSGTGVAAIRAERRVEDVAAFTVRDVDLNGVYEKAGRHLEALREA